MSNTGIIDMSKYEALPDLLTTTEVASILRCSDRVVIRHCKRGTFRAVKAAKSWRINKDDVLRYAGLI